MHDPKFEKEVQQKMEELEFSPSEAVWANISLAVKKEKRRRVPIFWLFFLPVFLAAGGAGLYWMKSHSGITEAHTSATSPSGAHPSETDAVTNNTTVENNTTIHPSGNATPPSGKENNAPTGKNTGKSRHSGRKSLIAETVTGLPPVTKLPATTGQPAAEQPAITTTAREPAMTAVWLTPFSIKNAPKITAAQPAAKKNEVSKTQLNPKRPWEAGFAGGVGISSLNQAIFRRTSSITVSDFANRNSAPITNYAAAAAPPHTYVSKVEPDLSFWLGVFVQKPLLNRLFVSLGLNLHYYSTRLYFGDKIAPSGGGALLSAPSGAAQYLASLSAAAAPSPPSYPYYTPGDKQLFTNRYYFMELPVSIQWQLTRNRRMPLFWETGLSLSYLASSNGLYYDNRSGVYVKDGPMANRFQIGASTGLMVGIPFKGVNLQVGPQLQYGFTSLLDVSGMGSQHLFFGGLKLAVIPGKSHKAGRKLFREQ